MVDGWGLVRAGSTVIAHVRPHVRHLCSPGITSEAPLLLLLLLFLFVACLPCLSVLFRFFSATLCVCSEKRKPLVFFFLSISSRMIPGEKKQKTLLHRFHASAAADEPTRASKRPATHATPPVLQPTRLASSPAREGLPS